MGLKTSSTDDLDENGQGSIRKFVYDIKVGGVVDGEDGHQELYDQLGKCAEVWLMEFHSYKCEGLHVMKSNKTRTSQ